MAKKLKTRKKKNTRVFWAILVLVLFPAAFNVAAMVMPKRYTAEMRLMVDESATGNIVSPGPYFVFDDFQSSSRARSASTQLDVLTGTTVLQNAYQLAADRIPDKMIKSGDPSTIYDNLVRRLVVDNEPTSDILSVKVTEDDPTLAAELANDIGLAYIDYTKKLKTSAATLMSEQLKDQIDPLLAKLKSIDTQIGVLKRKSNIYDVASAEANIGSTKEAADRNLANAMAAYDGGEAQLGVAEAELKKTPKYVDSGSHTQVNPVLISLQTTLATENVNLAQLKAQYQDSFPMVKEEEQKIANIRKQLQTEEHTIPSEQDRSINPVYQTQESALAQLRAQVQAYAGQLAAAQAEQRRSQAAVDQIPAAEQALQSLIRDRTTYELTYEQLAQRQTTAIHSLEIQRAPAEIVSPALPPTMPTFPDKKLLTMAGIGLGIFMAVLILMPRPEVVTEVQYEPEAPRPDPLPRAPFSPEPVLEHVGAVEQLAAEPLSVIPVEPTHPPFPEVKAIQETEKAPVEIAGPEPEPIAADEPAPAIPERKPFNPEPRLIQRAPTRPAPIEPVASGESKGAAALSRALKKARSKPPTGSAGAVEAPPTGSAASRR